MLYNESKHKILALVGNAKNTLEMRFFFRRICGNRKNYADEPAYVYEFRFSWWCFSFLSTYSTSRRATSFCDAFAGSSSPRSTRYIKLRERERYQPATHSDHAQTNGFRSASHAVDVVEENLSFLAFLYDRHVRRTIESSDFCDMILCIAGGAFWFLPWWSTN